MAYTHLLIYFTMYINNFFFHYIFKHVRRGGREHKAAGHRQQATGKKFFMKPAGLRLDWL